MDTLTKPNKTYWLAQHTLSWRGGVDEFRLHLSKRNSVSIKLEVRPTPPDEVPTVLARSKSQPRLGFDIACNYWSCIGLGIVWFSWNDQPVIQFWKYSNRRLPAEVSQWSHACSILEWRATQALKGTQGFFQYDRVSEMRPEHKPRFL